VVHIAPVQAQAVGEIVEFVTEDAIAAQKAVEKAVQEEVNNGNGKNLPSDISCGGRCHWMYLTRMDDSL